MEYEIIRRDADGAFDAFVLHHPKGHILQTFAWSRVKTAWQAWGVVVRRKGRICGTMLLLARRVPGLGTCMLYAPRGPVCMLSDAPALEALLSGAREVAARTHAYVLRMDPDVPAQDAAFRGEMARLGAVLLPDAGNLEHIQAQHVMRIALTGRTPEEVFAAFRPKTRYNVRVAMRHGVTVRAVDETYLDDFCALMQQTGLRDGFAVRKRAYFEAVLRNLGKQAQLYMAFAPDGTPLAGAIAAWGGGKMLYLYGASANRQRALMPTYLLQWHMICEAMARGCAVYDLRGVPLDPQHSPIAGLYRFKSGFGGQRVDFVGEYHVIYRPVLYRVLERLLPVARRALSAAAKARARLARQNEPDAAQDVSAPHPKYV